MNYPIIKISAYKAWTGKDGKPRPGCKPYDTDFYSEMDRIKNGFYKPIVDQYRKITDSEEKYKYKVTQLPSLTISAVCVKWRKLENVVSHSGLLNLDIDAKTNQHITDWHGLRDQIFKLQGVVASFLSVSGNGVTFVVKIRPEQHKDSFFSIVDGMKQHMGINVDAALHDVTRLRFVSFDPETKIRYNFEELTFSEPSQLYLENKKNYGSAETILEPIGDVDSEYNFNEAVKRASQSLSFADGNKWSFLVSVAGTCNIMGMSMEYCCSQVIHNYRALTNISNERLLKPVKDIYHLYKSQHGIYDIEASFERLNRRLKEHLIYEWLHNGKEPTREDVVEIAKNNEANIERVEYCIDRVFGEYSEEFDYNKFPIIKKVQVWLSKRYNFKFNKVTAQPEMSEFGCSNLITVNPDEIYRQLQLNRFKYGLDNIKSLLRSSFVKSYDPIEDYFKSLSFDGSTDYINKLSSYVNTEEGEFWNKQFKKCLVRCIACGLGVKENRIVMVLYGKKQETGKSTFIRFLSPWSEGKYFTESPIIGGNQKDTEIRFSENFIYNLEELAGLSRVDVNKLKADISKSSIKERRSYAAFETCAPRRCNFWASTNQKEFLHDEENTRWLIFDILNINWAYKQDIDINKVWGQAWKLYQDGFDYNLDADDRIMRETLNEEYRYRRPEEELIARHFKPAEDLSGQFYSATEVAGILSRIYPALKINPNNIGKTMTSVYGLESSIVKINGKNTRGYWLYNSFTDADGEKPRNQSWSPME